MPFFSSAYSVPAPPVDSAATSERFFTVTTDFAALVLPSPSRPWSLSPQACTCPVSVSA